MSKQESVRMDDCLLVEMILDKDLSDPALYREMIRSVCNRCSHRPDPKRNGHSASRRCDAATDLPDRYLAS